MENRKKSVGHCRSLKTTFLLSIAVVCSIVTSQASVALAYSPLQQSSDGETSPLLCIWLVILLFIVLLAITNRNRTRKAPEYRQRLSTALQRPELEAIVNEMFPKGSWVSSTFGWKRESSTEDILVLSRTYFRPNQGCLIYLLTGLLPGVLIISLMGRTEKVTVDMSAVATNNKIVVKGQGERGREQAEKLVVELVKTQQASVIEEDH